MQLTIDQLVDLLANTAGVNQDTLGCDDCFALLDQFAQAELDGTGVPAALAAVQAHLEQCACCRDEYAALLTALREVQD
ncbi:MAG: hypothetical protein ACRCT8_07635 [Lacipirellulaceae bacterium]